MSPKAGTESSDQLYLWLSCEGWVRFGPYRWLRLLSDPETGAQQIINQKREVIAYEDRDNRRWRSTDPNYRGQGVSGWAFRDPVITANPNHPHPNRFR